MEESGNPKKSQLDTGSTKSNNITKLSGGATLGGKFKMVYSIKSKKTPANISNSISQGSLDKKPISTGPLLKASSNHYNQELEQTEGIQPNQKSPSKIVQALDQQSSCSKNESSKERIDQSDYEESIDNHNEISDINGRLAGKQSAPIFKVQKRKVLKSINDLDDDKLNQYGDIKLQDQQSKPKQNQSSSRSEKSLGEICLKFLNKFGSSTTQEKVKEVNVEECVGILGIERRRMYDIVNILESFEMVRRIQKNVYEVLSPETIKNKIEDLETKEAQKKAETPSEGPQLGGLSFIEEQMNPNLISIKTKKHKSLGVLNLIFIKLFIQKGPLLSLDDAAEYIFDEDDDGQEKFKSKSRRLYDIANVLKSLGIIQKQKNSLNKNVFVWIGSKGFSIEKNGVQEETENLGRREEKTLRKLESKNINSNEEEKDHDNKENNQRFINHSLNPEPQDCFDEKTFGGRPQEGNSQIQNIEQTFMDALQRVSQDPKSLGPGFSYPDFLLNNPFCSLLQPSQGQNPFNVPNQNPQTPVQSQHNHNMQSHLSQLGFMDDPTLLRKRLMSFTSTPQQPQHHPTTYQEQYSQAQIVNKMIETLKRRPTPLNSVYSQSMIFPQSQAMQSTYPQQQQQGNPIHLQGFQFPPTSQLAGIESTLQQLYSQQQQLYQQQQILIQSLSQNSIVKSKPPTNGEPAQRE
ncbi:hypothetical protein FGO68_gene14283 [Halteria grandinella]|uniref:E2F/DP family winged-helix DNA-binding domain-containing protein n=1 Tax=Halteria grandinella TaxID=5974 RepID=A0A8J8T7C6_HALGN|nr:hypothetical protein FGO68_gene14283 [Halteria grandinella]